MLEFLLSLLSSAFFMSYSHDIPYLVRRVSRNGFIRNTEIICVHQHAKIYGPIVCLISFLLWLPLTNTQLVQGHVGLIFSVLTNSPPLMDGINSPGEWDDAAQISVFAESFEGRLFVMNDINNLYLALSVNDSAISDGDILEVRFDNNHDGVNTIGDDNLFVSLGGLGDSHFNGESYGSGDSQQDGVGAVANDNATNFFEVSHPLNSGDPNDFALSLGDTVGFCIRYFDDGVSTSDTTHPVDCVFTVNAQRQYGDIVVMAPESGDANGDGSVDELDITTIALHIVEIQLLPNPLSEVADVSPAAGKPGTIDPNTCGDGAVNVLDIIAVANAILSGDAAGFLKDRCTL